MRLSRSTGAPMTNLLFGDSAYPPSPYPAGFDGWGFYIGGDTPHVWSKAEVDAIPTRLRLPIFTRSNPAGIQVTADTNAAIAQLKIIGAPTSTLVMLDSETSIDPNYVAGFYYGMRNGGYTTIEYGSLSTIFSNRIPDGLYDVAEWTNRNHIVPGSQMTQWESFDAYDVNTALPTLPFWDTGKGNPMASMPGVYTRLVSVEHQTSGDIVVSGESVSSAHPGETDLWVTTFTPGTNTWSTPVHIASYATEG